MPQTAKTAAMSLLARREHSRRELAEKLSRRFGAAAVLAALKSLEQSGMLSDLRYARAYLREAGRKFGREKLRQNLQSRGVHSADIDSAMKAEISGGECARAAAVLAAKYGGAVLAEGKPQARALRFLHSRGFLAEDAECAVARRAKENPDNSE